MNHSKPRTRRRNRPQVNGVSNYEYNTQPLTVLVPPSPTAETKPEREEQQVYRTEQLMLQGFRDPRQLMPILGIDDSRVMSRYVNRVKARWKMTGGGDSGAKLGEALAELEFIHQCLSTEYGTAASTKDKVNILNSMARLCEKKNQLRNLTPETISALGRQSKIPDNVLRSMVKQEELVDTMRVFAAIIKEEREKRQSETTSDGCDFDDMPDAID